MAIQKIISDLISRAKEASASDFVQCALSLDSRIPEEDKLVALTSAECYAIECITNEDCKFSNDGNFCLGFRPHGRLHILPREDFDSHSEHLALIGQVEFTENQLRRYRSLSDSQQLELESGRSSILDYLSRHGLENVCRELLSLSTHMAPLIYYVGECCISNFYDVGKSDFKLEFTLEAVLGEVIEEGENSRIEFLTLAFCLHLLLRSGAYTRLEELNATQLSKPAVDAFFDDKYDVYQRSGGIDLDTDNGTVFLSSSLEEKAVSLANMRNEIKSSTCRFVREVNGINLRKKENILQIPSMVVNAPVESLKPSEFTENVLRRWWALNGISSQALLPSFFAELIGKCTLPQSGQFASSLESLVDFVVTEAVGNTSSDFGMTRGTRDFHKFSKSLSGKEVDLACSWGQKEYFCHVVPNEKMKVENSPKTLIMMLNAISGRMRFNTWHYAPSYFSVDSIPDSRDWFYAPQMADLADHSDQHHTGHVHASVRFSIRSPLPICIGETVLPGFIDLRLMRQSGEPYSREDLICAIQYTETLQFIYQNLMNHLLRENKEFAFSFGDKSWIRQNYTAGELKIAV